jgi:hypothetical protein
MIFLAGSFHTSDGYSFFFEEFSLSNFIHLCELVFLYKPTTKKKKLVMVLESVAFYGGPLFGRRGRFVLFEVRLFTVQNLTENCILESENEFPILYFTSF